MVALPELRPAIGHPEHTMQDRLQRLVGEAVVLEVVRAGAAPTGETPTVPGPSPFLRHRQYRDGRSALGRVLSRLGLPDHPVTISLPHPRLSLTHTGDIAVAVGLRCAQASGVGVDIEQRRPIPTRSARFFLDDDEQQRQPAWAALEGRDEDAQQLTLQRLWTVKEAVFKAHLANAGRRLRDYHVDLFEPQTCPGEPGGDPWIGRAHHGPDVFGFRTVVVDDLVLTIALHERTSS